MDVRDFDFHLPSELIAQEPPADRTSARMLVLDRGTGAIAHACVSALPEFLRAGDLVVVNNTRVFPARLLGRRVRSGGAVECLLIRHVAGEIWEGLVHPGQKLKPGSQVVFERPDAPGAPLIRGEVLERRFFGRREIRLWTDDGSPIDAAIEAVGHVPLPPYIKRADRPADRDRYQTVYARERGSVAAPTAGLHFTPSLLSSLRDRRVELTEITLHVGYGTFQPVRVDRVEEHRVESEWYRISDGAAASINGALESGRRIVAVGTTTTRALESAGQSGRVLAGARETELFIYPGHEFRVVRGLMTNFHLPQSSLLMLVSAFAARPSTHSGRPELTERDIVEGRERVLRTYDQAVRERYRFYSYGDAMLIL